MKRIAAVTFDSQSLATPAFAEWSVPRGTATNFEDIAQPLVRHSIPAA